MSENEMTTIDRRHLDNMQFGYLYCSMALEQVLADVVAEKGASYLDYVVERTVRRIKEQQDAAIAALDSETKENFARLNSASSKIGEEALRVIVQRVKDDPNPVP
ncbi:hypothetical protein O9X81_00320 [Agrobacterium salinitolerans]|uniref:hypothetical protein n=1 Tax=Agrobacterium salinitolerans TaxID=1183413 RepID=UPI0022B83915|nr:hypothetical protein [Agrobacterium salinitolerans]MCZ7855052.1 hypothetical protein [Agrobacterium salinitolerans]